MFKFLKILFNSRKKKVTVILVQENKPAEPDTFSFFPSQLVNTWLITIFIAIAFFFIFLSVTPIGQIAFFKEDEELKAFAQDLSKRLVQLSDSLKHRDDQIRTIQSVLREESDTTFSIESMQYLMDEYNVIDERTIDYTSEPFQYSDGQVIDAGRIIFSGTFSESPEFPSPRPLSGTLTQKFNIDEKHFGIDIASANGSIVRSIADGVVISAYWTINYGNTIQIQHGDGYISIFKHCSSLLKKEGDIVLKGDGIGVIGLSGMINTGPHVHVELWKDGIALDPELYLMTE